MALILEELEESCNLQIPPINNGLLHRQKISTIDTFNLLILLYYGIYGKDRILL